ncbi:MAG: ROK family protein [Chthoniobacter sp.]|uniref:ROK family protein n=1 Tax=Chthoniobacter sp. TaxID=2510640 RepID=UPI0032A420E2
MTATPHFVAIEIGGTKLQLCVGTAEGSIVDRRRFLVDRERGAEGIREQIAQGVPELIAKWQPAAIGVGYGGPVDWRTGRIWRSYHIAGWSDFPLGDWLREQTGLPVYVENDSNLATLGEAICGAGKGMNPVFYTNMGSGVGGGLAVDGRIYHGAPPGEMELGHLRLHGPGRIVEDDCSGWSLDKRIREAVATAPQSKLAQLVAADPGEEARHLTAALEAGDPVAQALIVTQAGHFANALGVVVQLLHPEVIVLGGGVSLIGEPLRAAVAERLPTFIMDVFHPGPRVRLAGLREDSVPVGALLMAADRFQISKTTH